MLSGLREKEARLKHQKQRKKKQNLVLLSFGEEAGDEVAELASNPDSARIRSAFDAVENDPRWASQTYRPIFPMKLVTDV